jgi:hypothetical protein
MARVRHRDWPHAKAKMHGGVCTNCGHAWPCPTAIALTDGIMPVALPVAA